MPMRTIRAKLYLFRATKRLKHGSESLRVHVPARYLEGGGDSANADKQIRSIFEKNNAEVLVSRPWDERRLSYPVATRRRDYIT